MADYSRSTADQLSLRGLVISYKGEIANDSTIASYSADRVSVTFGGHPDVRKPAGSSTKQRLRLLGWDKTPALPALGSAGDSFRF